MTTVLIADADLVFAKELSRALEESGIVQVVDIALNGKLAIRMVEERHPDVLVMDILLPELDGLGVLEEISSATPVPIIIATSAFLSNYVAVAAMDLGIRQLITIALQNGVDIKTVSGMLGHFSAGFTLDTYAHVTTSAQKEAAQTMGNILSM